MIDQEREVYTFGPGPCILPLSVLKKTQEQFVNFGQTGLSLAEISHRGPVYQEINQNAQDQIRKFLNVPQNYKILFTQGGATTMNSAVPFNLSEQNDTANYLVTGFWGNQSFVESQKFVKSHLVAPLPKIFNEIPEEIQFSKDAKYSYYVENETVDGVEFKNIPFSPDIPIVCDMTSSLGTRPVDIEKYGVIFASAQKNFGPAGVCIAIIKDDFIGKHRKDCPQMLSWEENHKTKSAFNTPPVINTYMVGLTTEYLNQTGGLEYYSQLALKRQKLIYDAIDGSHGFYQPRVHQIKYRSRTNIIFHLQKEELTNKFLEEAKQIGLVELKAHVSTGGIRANIYNGMPDAGVNKLRDFIVEFQNKYQ